MDEDKIDIYNIENSFIGQRFIYNQESGRLFEVMSNIDQIA